MTLTITVELSAEVEAELRTSIAQRNTERVRQVLTDALTPTVESLLQQSLESPENDQDWAALASQLEEEFAAAAAPDTPILSMDAVSRASIYEEHP